MKSVLFLIVILFIISCSVKDEPVEEKNILNRTFSYPFGIYFLSGDTNSVQRFENEVKKRLPEFSEVSVVPDSIVSDSYYLKYQKNLVEDFTPPDTSYLSFSAKGLTKEQKLKLQSVRYAIQIEFYGSNKNIIDKLKRISQLIDKVYKEKDVVIIDYSTVNSYTPASWKKLIVDNLIKNNVDISTQVVLHLYRDDEFCRAITLGMGKFCLPDISMNDISCNNQGTYCSFINSLCQTLYEKPLINGDMSVVIDLKKIRSNESRNKLRSDLLNNPKELVKLKLSNVNPEEGDNLNKQFLIQFDDPAYSSPQEEQEHVISELFGTKDSIRYIKHNNELLVVSKKARERLPELKKLFNKGLAPGYSILLKAPFKTDEGGTEWMWVEVTKWKTERMTGILQNDPFNIRDLKAGAIVKILEFEVFDYMLYKPDGTYEGNETGKVIAEEQ